MKQQDLSCTKNCMRTSAPLSLPAASELDDANLRQLLLRDILSAHRMTHRQVAAEVGCSVSRVNAWMLGSNRTPVPARVIAELARRFPTPYARRQAPELFAEA